MERDERSVRPATPADHPAIAALAAEVVAAGDAFAYDDVPGVMGYWIGPSSEAFVCEVAGEVLGTYAIKPNYPGRGAHVANIGYMVARRARGHGLGRTLGEHSLHHARQRGYRAVQFNFVVATNAGALRLWESLGFRIVGTLPRVFEHRSAGYVDAHVLFREL